MISGKKIVASTLLAAVLFTIVIVPMSTQQGGSTYDPWLDYNEDGVIDVNDLHPLGGAYGTTGDPTKNVNVTNWPSDYKVQTVSINVTWTNYHGFAQSQPIIYVGGYSRLTMAFNPTNMSERESEVTVSAYFVDWWIGWPPPTWAYANEYIPSGLFVATAVRTLSGDLGCSGHTSILETKANYCDFRFNCTSPNYSGWATFDVNYYLRNE